MTALSTYQSPKPLVIAERFRFHKQEQKDGESIKTYAASLQKLADHCNFGEALMETLRDMLVCSMRNEAVQTQLLTKEDLTFAMAQEWAETEERASKDAEQLDSRVQHTNFSGAMSTRSILSNACQEGILHLLVCHLVSFEKVFEPLQVHVAGPFFGSTIVFSNLSMIVSHIPSLPHVSHPRHQCRVSI